MIQLFMYSIFIFFYSLIHSFVLVILHQCSPNTDQYIHHSQMIQLLIYSFQSLTYPFICLVILHQCSPNTDQYIHRSQMIRSSPAQPLGNMQLTFENYEKIKIMEHLNLYLRTSLVDENSFTVNLKYKGVP